MLMKLKLSTRAFAQVEVGRKHVIEIDPMAQSYKTEEKQTNRNTNNNANLASILPNFFLCKLIIFPFSAAKLDHCILNTFFSFVTNTQALQQKPENEEKQS